MTLTLVPFPFDQFLRIISPTKIEVLYPDRRLILLLSKTSKSTKYIILKKNQE